MTEPAGTGGLRHTMQRAARWVRHELRGRRGRIAAAALGALIVAAGLTVALTGGPAHRTAALPPTPPSPSASTSSTAPAATHTAGTATRRASSTAKAAPFRCSSSTSGGAGLSATHLCIPAIGVNTALVQLGLNADRTVQVPPLSEVGLAGWYKYSPAPGVVGPSIILGHVDSAQYGKGVFFDLGRLRSGARVTLDRADGMVATYRIDKVAQYPKRSFPTSLVYGDTATPTLRLITCGGAFDASAGSYEDNIIAFGSLLSLRRA